MRVSVVTPSFNRGRLLLESVESALGQTYTDLDVTVVDDGSTDPYTLEILGDLQRMQRVSIVRQENSGIAAAINAGVRSSIGEFVLVLCDDDLIAPTYAEKAVSRLVADENLGVVYCQARTFGAVNASWRLPEFSPGQMAIGNCVFTTAFFRRCDWETVGGHRESLDRGYEDYDFWIRMIMLGRRFEQIPEELFFYRVGHSGLTAAYHEDERLKAKLLDIVYSENSEFFASQVQAILRELCQTRSELRRWKGDYSALDRLAGRGVRFSLRAIRRFRG